MLETTRPLLSTEAIIDRQVVSIPTQLGRVCSKSRLVPYDTPGSVTVHDKPTLWLRA